MASKPYRPKQAVQCPDIAMLTCRQWIGGNTTSLMMIMDTTQVRTGVLQHQLLASEWLQISLALKVLCCHGGVQMHARDQSAARLSM